MPWSNQGGGPWGSGGSKGPWGSGPQSSGPTPPDLEELLRDRCEHGHAQVAMRDRPAERRLLRPLRIDVDVVVILGDVGELVDAFLRHLAPLGRTEVLPDQAGQLRQRRHQNE